MLKENNLLEVFHNLHEKVQSCGMKGYDPRLLWYLPLASRYHKNKTKFNNLLRRAEVAICRYFPLVVPFYLKLSKIPLVENPYGIGLLIQSYINIYQKTANKEWLNIAIDYEKKLKPYLMKTKSQGIGISVPLEDENIFNIPSSSEVGIAYLNIFEATDDSYYFDVANKISYSFLNDYNMKENDKGYCIDYYSNGDGMHVLNANALAMEVIYRVNQYNRTESINKIVKKMFDYNYFYLTNYDSLPYAGIEDKNINSNWHSYDIYHTGFTIRSMKYIVDREVELSYISDDLKNKYELMKKDFINVDNKVTVLKGSKIVDIHGVAEFIRCYAAFEYRNKDSDFSDIVLDNFNYMYINNSFYYQRGIVDSYPYMPRWGHAPMMLALAELI